jgi:predicted site-specific integrase-resolvase
MAEIITRNLPVAESVEVEEESKDLEPGDGEFMVISEKHNNATVVGTARNPSATLFPDRHDHKQKQNKMLENEMLRIMSMQFPDRRTFKLNENEIKEVIIESLSAEDQRILRKSEQYVRKRNTAHNPEIDELKEHRKKIMSEVNRIFRKISNKLYGARSRY